MSSLITSFSALSDSTRLGIVEHLMDHGETSAGDLGAGTGMTAPAISRHLKVLRAAGLIEQRADGTKRYYSARTDGLRAIADWTTSRRAFWETSLDRLEAAILQEGQTPDD